MSNFNNGGRTATPPAVRILDRITKADGDTGCWIFQGATGSEGYGQVRVVVPGVPTSDRKNRYKTREAHRVIFETVHGPVPDGYSVWHSCRHRLCVNPEHLWLHATSGPINYAALKRAA